MNQTTIPLLKRIHHETSQSEYAILDLPEQQGLVILPQTCPPQEQIKLLKQLITSIESNTLPPTQTVEESRSSTEQDCQVTVEERAQLFKSLSSS